MIFHNLMIFFKLKIGYDLSDLIWPFGRLGGCGDHWRVGVDPGRDPLPQAQDQEGEAGRRRPDGHHQVEGDHRGDGQIFGGFNCDVIMAQRGRGSRIFYSVFFKQFLLIPIP